MLDTVLSPSPGTAPGSGTGPGSGGCVPLVYEDCLSIHVLKIDVQS